ncbi:MAG TPA: hypothetical protein VFA21_21965 [Pyrinomonadaceae bacterium]|jgi:hypothetical protein|nr:hypothetical protein [Pyrinomonadaceae bacterium]
MDTTPSFTRRALAVLFSVALVAALAAAVWGVYSRLPRDERGSTASAGTGGEGATVLRIRLRLEGTGTPVSAQKIPVQLFPINMTAAREEFDSEHRPGQRFEDFATKQMGDRQPLSAELDERGEATLAVPPGKWWIHATVEGERELTWRLPVNLSGGEKTVELTPDNAYTRAKKF